MKQVLLKKAGVSLSWPENLIAVAAQSGWAAPPEEEDVPDEVHVVSKDCPPGMVEVRLPLGTKETNHCLKTPDWFGAERWFTKSRLHAYWFDGECWMIQLIPEELKKRRLTHLIP